MLAAAAKPAFPPFHITDPLEREDSKQWTHLYAAPQPILHLARGQDSSYMQMFHLQAMQFIANNNCILQKEREQHGATGISPASAQPVFTPRASPTVPVLVLGSQAAPTW